MHCVQTPNTQWHWTHLEDGRVDGVEAQDGGEQAQVGLGEPGYWLVVDVVGLTASQRSPISLTNTTCHRSITRSTAPPRTSPPSGTGSG
jgi:hypothetical protein